MGILLKSHQALNLINSQEIEKVKGIVKDILNSESNLEIKLEVLQKEKNDTFVETTNEELKEQIVKIIDKAISQVKREITIQKKENNNL
jgi:hypothetical protein